MSSSPFPVLNVHPNSGLTFPWTESIPGGSASSFDGSFGPDGVALAFVMKINWSDLSVAIQQLLGYSWRDTSNPGRSMLRRILPWKHPYNNQLFVKSISSVKGIKLQGKQEFSSAGGSGTGAGSLPNTGPWSEYQFAELVLHFWRPPYYLRSDDDILDGTGDPQEWLRYVDKNWEINTAMLTREGSTFVFVNAPGATSGPVAGNTFQGSVGQPLPKMRITKKWYQVPEAGLFTSAQDVTPNGIPQNLVYMQTETNNPITNYFQTPTVGYPIPILGCVNTPIGAGGFPATYPLDEVVVDVVGSNYSSAPTITFSGGGGSGGQAVAILNNGTVQSILVTVGGAYQTPPLVNISGGGGSGAIGTAYLGGPFVTDLDRTKRLFGCRMGTLLYIGCRLIPRELQMPASLMQIPLFTGSEPISQQQYDVEFHFDFFDPPLGPGVPNEYRGHNCMPFSGNALWYPVISQISPQTTPFQYADLSDIFKIL